MMVVLSEIREIRNNVYVVIVVVTVPLHKGEESNRNKMLYPPQYALRDDRIHCNTNGKIFFTNIIIILCNQ